VAGENNEGGDDGLLLNPITSKNDISFLF
jgi:hypothetical protein